MRSVFQRMARGLWAVSLEVGKRWWRHSHSRSAAALAFYSLFSMVPILVIVTGLASTFIGQDRAVEGVGQAAKELFDDKSGTYLRDLLSARPDDTFTGISSLIGFFVLLFTASKVVVELRSTLTVVFGRKISEGRHGLIIDWLKGQVIPLLLVLALGVVLVVSALAAAALQVLAVHLSDYLPRNFAFWGWMQKVVPLVFETLLFALILRWLPAKPPRFPQALTGAVVTCVLLMVLRSLIGFYFGQSSVTTAYGAAVTLVVVLLWIYFTIQIFFIGAETSAYLERKKQGEAEEPEGL
jgi:membrane protein